jgi:hypothetical protein
MAMRPAQHLQHQLESTPARGGVRSLIGRRRRYDAATAKMRQDKTLGNLTAQIERYVGETDEENRASIVKKEEKE